MTTTTDAHIPAGFGFDRGDVDPDLIMTDEAAEHHVEALNDELKKRLKNQLNVTWYPATNTGVKPYDNPVDVNHPDTPTMEEISNQVWRDYNDEEIVEFTEEDLK